MVSSWAKCSRRVRRATLPAGRVEKPPLAIRADIAGADTRDPGQVVEPEISQPGTLYIGRGTALNRDNACAHCTRGCAVRANFRALPDYFPESSGLDAVICAYYNRPAGS